MQPESGSASGTSTERSAREAILGRVREAIGEGDARPALEPMPPSSPDDARELVARFAERVEDYRSTVTVVGATGASVPGTAHEAESAASMHEAGSAVQPHEGAMMRADSVAAAVSAACGRTGARRVGVPAGFDQGLVPDGVEIVPVAAGTRETALSFGALDAVVCTAPLGIAETGTIVLDAGTGQGPRAASLLPDVLIVVIDASALVGGVVAAVDRMRSVVVETARPLTMISGPSATSDIELDRVEGVHGPRTLEVIVVDDGG